MGSIYVQDSTGAKNFLRRNFVPGEDDVIIGRGKKCYQHVGNERLRHIVALALDEYSVATTKTEKSKILSTIVSKIRKSSPQGGFIKQDSSSGLWYEVGDFMAREKVSQAFRDALYKEYRSSNDFKKKRRRKNAKVKVEDILPISATMNPKKIDEKQFQHPWDEDELSIGLLDIQLEPSCNMAYPRDVSTLSASIPDSSFLASWFEGDNSSSSNFEMMQSSPMELNEKDNCLNIDIISSASSSPRTRKSIISKAA